MKIRNSNVLKNITTKTVIKRTSPKSKLTNNKTNYRSSKLNWKKSVCLLKENLKLNNEVQNQTNSSLNKREGFRQKWSSDALSKSMANNDISHSVSLKYQNEYGALSSFQPNKMMQSNSFK